MIVFTFGGPCLTFTPAGENSWGWRAATVSLVNRQYRQARSLSLVETSSCWVRISRMGHIWSLGVYFGSRKNFSAGGYDL